MWGGVVLLDTMVILGAHRTESWKTLAARYRLETVEKCIEETQTGAQNRPHEHRIDEATLRGGFHMVHAVNQIEQAQAALRDSHHAMLHDGERALWAHALGRTDAWVLCGPDIASLRLGVRLGLRDQLVALEALLADVGLKKPKSPLGRNYTRAWHAERLARLALEEGRGPA